MSRPEGDVAQLAAMIEQQAKSAGIALTPRAGLATRRRGYRRRRPAELERASNSAGVAWATCLNVDCGGPKMTKRRTFQEFIQSRGLRSEAGGEFIDYAKADPRFPKIDTWNDLRLYLHKRGGGDEIRVGRSRDLDTVQGRYQKLRTSELTSASRPLHSQSDQISLRH